MSLIFSDDNRVRLGGVLLPGIVQKIEVTSTAAIDQVEVEGNARSPKQAVGYEDSLVKIELILGDSSDASVADKLTRLYNLFRRKGQEIPQPLDIICVETAQAGVDRLLFKKLNRVSNKNSDLVTVSLEFDEYVPLTVTATKTGGAATAPAGAATTPRAVGQTGSANQSPSTVAQPSSTNQRPTIGNDGVTAPALPTARPSPTIGKDGMTTQPLPSADPTLLAKLRAANNRYGGA